MESKPFFSIIVPVYKVEKYIYNCVDSVLGQTYHNYEIILVDDGSPDNCPAICDKYKDNDKRIKVIHKKNGGLSDARNYGIKHSCGQYILFIDSDDFLCDENALLKIKQRIDAGKSDVLVYGHKKTYESIKKSDKEKKKNKNVKNVLIEEMIKHNQFKACAWDKAINRQLIDRYQIEFPINMYSEDISWCANILMHTNKYDLICENLYAYRQREGSITKKLSRKNITDIIEQIIEVAQKGQDNENKDILYNYLAYEYAVLLGLIRTKGLRKQIDKKLENKIYEMKWLLRYSKSNKVKFVRIIEIIVGIKNTSLILGRFIDMKG